MQLSIVTLGDVHSAAFEPLALHLTRLEHVVTNLPGRASLTENRAELNRAIDAAANDWILVLREREHVGEALAAEIAGVMDAGEAWGFRLRLQVLYAGKPLKFGASEPGELRLFHRRHFLRRGELAVQGTVVRLRNALEARSFESCEEHLAWLQKRGVPHSTIRRTLLFLRNARTLDANTLHYVWIEAGFDHS